MALDATERAEVLKVISDVQQSTASVTVQIGGVSDSTGIVENESLYIKNCPPKIISELTGMGYSLAATEDGVRVR